MRRQRGAQPAVRASGSGHRVHMSEPFLDARHHCGPLSAWRTHSCGFLDVEIARVQT